ncbi:MAG TPA: 30S ribosomal protein S4 [Candidatus Paceibacterota bacterium]|nr:30S ribosomal protein S4 [Candidatus Paceibacterota bacterium]HPT40501.1 30S ribosomal protein S4 [Candidatus Paceibacterota bacterium]
MQLDIKCRKCRAIGEKLFLKGDRCFSPKCAMIKRPFKPGMHKKTKSRGGISEYARQLTEKKKMKLIYRIDENQLRRYFKESLASKGSTTEVLFKKLEMRLDNIVFRLGLAPSRSVSRQLVNHGHFWVNGRKLRIPSKGLKIGDVVTVRPQSLEKPAFKNLKETIKKQEVPNFLSLNREKIEGKVVSEPSMAELKPPFNISLVVEFYSK